MSKFNFLKDGEIGLVTTENNRIVQLGITPDTHKTITVVIAACSKETPLVKMGEEHDLVLKSQYKTLLSMLVKTREKLVVDENYKTWSHFINEVDLAIKRANEIMS